MHDSMNLWISGLGLLLAACSVSTRGQADDGQSPASTSTAVEPSSTSSAASTTSPSPTTGDAPGTTATTDIPDTGTTNDVTTGADTGDACPACESDAAACEASQACQAVAGLEPDCPAEKQWDCLQQIACQNLAPDDAIAGLSLWLKLDRCVSRECGSATCIAEEDTCMGNAACTQVDTCVQQTCLCLSGDPVLVCLASCWDMFPDGKDAWMAWVSCLVASNSRAKEDRRWRDSVDPERVSNFGYLVESHTDIKA